MKKLWTVFLVVAFLANSLMPSGAYAQTLASAPAVQAGEAFQPLMLRGIRVFPDDPLKFDFMVDPGDSVAEGELLKAESRRLVRYFLASLTTPEEDMWVNLSPLEPDRIVPDQFGITEMGRDMLAEDYNLKQIASSLTDPDTETGRIFWARVYEKVSATYGAVDIPVDVMNRVWIAPEKAVVHEDGDRAVVTEMSLKVMLESDYFVEGRGKREKARGEREKDPLTSTQELSKKIMREVIVPILQKEVNEGKVFARVRQIYASMILAAWFKRRFRESLLGAAFVDRGKTSGVDIENKNEKEKIYNDYLIALKKGAYNFIREEADAFSGEVLPRKYFSGGLVFKLPDQAMTVEQDLGLDNAMSLLRGAGIVTFLLGVFLVGCAPQGPSQGVGLPPGAAMTYPVNDPGGEGVPGAATPLAGSGSLMALNNDGITSARDPLSLMDEEYRWNAETEQKIREFRETMGPEWSASSVEEKIIAVANFIKQSGGFKLGIKYAKTLTGTKLLRDKGGDPAYVIANHKAICVGFARLFYFLFGQDAGILEVQDPQSGEWDHVANVVHYDDGRVALVDLSTDTQNGFIMTEPFFLNDFYERDGDVLRLKTGASIPFKNHNFNPSSNQNDAYRTLRTTPATPYNMGKVFEEYRVAEKGVLGHQKEGGEDFDRDNYAEAIRHYQAGMEAANLLLNRLDPERHDPIRYVLDDPDQAIMDLQKFIETCQKNINSATINAGNGFSSSGPMASSAEEARQINQSVEDINRWMKAGIAAVKTGNYLGGKKYFEDVVEEVTYLKENHRDVLTLDINLDKVEKAARENIEKLKAVVDGAQDVGGIDMNANNLTILATGRKVVFSPRYDREKLEAYSGFVPVITGIQPTAGSGFGPGAKAGQMGR